MLYRRLFFICLCVCAMVMPVYAQDYAEEVPDAVQAAAEKLTQGSACDEPAFLYYRDGELFAFVCENSDTEPAYYFTKAGVLKKSVFTLFSQSESALKLTDENKQMADKIMAAATKKIGEENEVQWIYQIVESGKSDVYSAVAYMADKGGYVSYLFDASGAYLSEKTETN